MTDMTTPKATQAVEVTQADRDAVEAYHRIVIGKIMSGDSSENYELLCQAFARHRLASTPTASEIATDPSGRNAVLEEAAITAYRVCAETRHVTLGREAATQIRALKSTPTDATAVEAHPAIVTAIGGYGGRCRDCADMGDGVCENRGLPCGERKYDAIRHVLRALAYYRENPHFLDQIEPRTKES